jgi:AcrR family transcriptional regulator
MARGDATHRLGPYRDPQVAAGVLAVTRELLTTRGYRRTSIDAIAEAAGVSRPTIYRRWPSKVHVIYEAVFPDLVAHIEPSAADAVDEIMRAVRSVIATMGVPWAKEATLGLMSDMRSDPTLRPELAARHIITVVAGLQELLDQNVDRIRPVDANTLWDVIAGAAVHALSIRDVTDLDAYTESLIDVLMHGILPH